MAQHSDDNWENLQAKIMGLGEHSLRKSHYPELQEKLKELERFKALIDQANDLIFLLQVPGGEIADGNQSACRQLGFSRESLLAKTLPDLLPPETAAWMRSYFSNLEENVGRREILTTSLRRKNGETFPVEMTLHLVPFHDSVYAVVVVRDITERSQALAALTVSEQKYRTLVESSSDAILMMDPQRKIVSCNRAFLDLFGYEENEVLGKSIRIAHVSDESFQSLRRTAFPIVQNMGSFRTEWQLKRKDGSIFPVEGSISVIKSPDGSLNGYVAIIRDVSDRKRAEEELRKHRDHLEEMVRERTQDLENAQKALLQREKLKTLGTISATVAHEIRNPLMSIGGFAKRLQKKFPGIPEVEIILKESERLENLLSRITTYLKPTEMGAQECYVNTVILECIDLLSPEMVQQNVQWEVNLPQDIPSAYVDPSILSQVLIHLMKNAFSTMDKTKPMVISAFESDQKIRIDLTYSSWAPECQKAKICLLPETNKEIEMEGPPLSFRMLGEMGGTLSTSRQQHLTIHSISLLKALKLSFDSTCTGNIESP
ncbi:MAG: PAS domain S-box protein [Deltaproteobacteria bacterium]|nr:PAS domain S-box protein [Deltaproteobacteria bacterium]